MLHRPLQWGTLLPAGLTAQDLGSADGQERPLPGQGVGGRGSNGEGRIQTEGWRQRSLSLAEIFSINVLGFLFPVYDCSRQSCH
jgi:hypothetical protein